MRYSLYFTCILLLLAAGHTVSAQEDAPTNPTPDGCRALMTNPVPDLQDDPTAIYIVEPTGSTIYGETLYVSVNTNNFRISAETGDHWHLWVNGELNTMVYEESVAVTLRPGTYELCAILGDPEHFDLGQPDGMTIQMVAAGPGTPVTQPQSAATAYAAPIRERGSIPVAAIVLAGVAAGAVGWWVGRLLPKVAKSSLKPPQK